MMRIAIPLLALALLVAACGDDDATASSTAAPSTTAAATTTTAAVTTTAAPTTTTEAATTTEPPTTTEAMTGPEAFIAAMVGLVGEYEGTWDNETFGSSGRLYFNVVEVNTDAGFVLIQVDADGSAFGQGDPDLTVIEISTAPEGLYTGFNPFVGESTFEIDADGNFTFVSEPPSLGMTLEITGTLTAEGFAGTYEIPGLAEGTFSAAPMG